MKKVSIILLVWNGENSVVSALSSISRQTYQNLEVIVIDNDSTDDSVKVISKALEDLSLPSKIMLNDSNIGFSAGMNMGFHHSDGDYVIPMGQDVSLAPEYITLGVEYLQSNSGVGAVGGEEWDWDSLSSGDKRQRSTSGALYLTKDCRGKKLNYFSKPTSSFGVTGSFPILRRDMIVDLSSEEPPSIFDEDLVTGYEDLDLWFRARWKGWDCVFLPSTGAWHIGSGSVGGRQGLFEKPVDYQRRLFRNRKIIILKNYDVKMFLKSSIALLMSEVLTFGYVTLVKRKSFVPYLYGFKDFLNAVPDTLKKRKHILKGRRIGFDSIDKYIK